MEYLTKLFFIVGGLFFLIAALNISVYYFQLNKKQMKKKRARKSKSVKNEHRTD